MGSALRYRQLSPFVSHSMSTLTTYLIPKLRTHFPADSFRLGTAPDAVAVFPAIHPEFGDVEIIDDGDELTVVLGKFTHSHFNCYEDNLSETDKSQKIVTELIKFLQDVFSDQVVFYGTQGVGGGCFSKERKPPENIRSKCYVWSGPVQLNG